MRVVPSPSWVRSDPILLERILLNLVSNAVRYTARGGVVAGCRRRGGAVRIDVCDSGIGIPQDHQRNVFGEFYRLAGAEQHAARGLGLGLAIVDRLCRLLDHPIELNSQAGRGSRFSLLIPLAVGQSEPAIPALMPQRITEHDRVADTLIVVIDDDELVRDGMRRLLLGWGCQVVSAASDEAALAGLASQDRRPDLIISDYRLAGGSTGLETIERLRGAASRPIPALLISGDTAPDRLREASASGHLLLHKPIAPAALRATLNHLLRQREQSGRKLQGTIS